MTTSLSQNDSGFIDKFRLKASQFMSAWNELTSMRNIPVNLQSEYTSLRSSGSEIQSTLQWITSAIDSVTGYVSNMFNFNGVDNVKGYINNDSNNMGFISLIPIAAIVASLAIMTKFISDVYVFKSKLNEQKRLENTGLNPQQAAKVVENMRPDSIIKNISKVVKPVGVVLSLLFIFKIIRELK